MSVLLPPIINFQTLINFGFFFQDFTCQLIADTGKFLFPFFSLFILAPLNVFISQGVSVLNFFKLDSWSRQEEKNLTLTPIDLEFYHFYAFSFPNYMELIFPL